MSLCAGGGKLGHAGVSPVHYVTGAQQSRGVDDGVPDRTRSVEVRVLTDQMAGQETPVRTADHSQALGVQAVVCLQRSQHGPLGRDARLKSRADG